MRHSSTKKAIHCGTSILTCTACKAMYVAAGDKTEREQANCRTDPQDPSLFLATARACGSSAAALRKICGRHISHTQVCAEGGHATCRDCLCHAAITAAQTALPPRTRSTLGSCAVGAVSDFSRHGREMRPVGDRKQWATTARPLARSWHSGLAEGVSRCLLIGAMDAVQIPPCGGSRQPTFVQVLGFTWVRAAALCVHPVRDLWPLWARASCRRLGSRRRFSCCAWPPGSWSPVCNELCNSRCLFSGGLPHRHWQEAAGHRREPARGPAAWPACFAPCRHTSNLITSACPGAAGDTRSYQFAIQQPWRKNLGTPSPLHGAPVRHRPKLRK